MSSRKKLKRQQKAQERQKLKQATLAYRKGLAPASEPEIGVYGDFDSDNDKNNPRG